MTRNDDRLREAFEAWSARDWGRAFAVVARIIEEGPGAVEAIRLKGNLLEAQALEEAAERDADFHGDPRLQEARSCYERALELSPDDPATRIDLAESFERASDLSRALDHFDAALARLDAPESANAGLLESALEGKFRVLRGMEREREARDLLEEALRRLPQSKVLRAYRGR